MRGASAKLPCASGTYCLLYTTPGGWYKSPVTCTTLVSLECHPVQVEVYLPVPVVSRPPMPPDLLDEVVHAPFEREAADDVALCVVSVVDDVVSGAYDI